VTGVIDGVTLTLLDDSSGNSINVSVSRNTQNVTGSVENFVAAYNDLLATFESLGGYNAETQTGGALLGDALLRNIERSLRGATTGFVDGLETSALRSLPDIGITTNAEGRLELDSSKLSAALDSAPEVIGNLFAATAFMSDSSVEFTGSTSASTPGLYAVTLTNLATRGAYTGDALASLTVNATNDALSVVVDGIQSNTVNLEQKTYSDGNALAAELQSKINVDSALGAEGVSVSVSFNAGKLVISSAAYGSDSNVTIASSDTDTLTTLGIGTSGGTSLGGTDIAGTLGGLAASGVGQTLTGSGDTAGLSVKVTGGNTGFRGDLTFSRGVGATLLELADVYLDTDAALESSIGSLTERVEALAGDREDLQIRLEATEARLRSQFAALDGLLAQLQSTSTFLTQQLSALPTPGR
jgi:flagellar hook-associated protein 2